MTRSTICAFGALLTVLAVGCADEPAFAPRFDLDGPTLRRQTQRKSVPPPKQGAAPEVVEKDFGDGADPEDLEALGLQGDIARAPFTSKENAELDAVLWPEETFAVGLTADQLLLLRRIFAGQVGRESYGRLFTRDAQVAHPVTPLGEPEVLALGVTKRAWVVEEVEMLDLEGFARELAGWQAPFARVRYVTFMPSSVEFEGQLARVGIDWQLNVELESGGLRHDRGTWTSEWIRDGAVATDDSPRPASSEGWICRRLAPVGGVTLFSEAPAFVDVTGESLAGTGVSPLVPRSDKEQNRGIVLVDVDGDGDLDLVTSIPNALLLGDGEGRFEDVTERVGIVRESKYMGIQAADFDRDGDIDIAFAGKRRQCLIYWQDEAGRFESRPLTVARADNIPASVTAHDVDGDGWLDLMICGYGPFMNPGPDDPGDATNARNNQMLRGGPNGFTDVTEAWGLWREGSRWTFIGAFGDADEDGDLDMYAANDFGPNVLYRRVQDSPPLFQAEVEPKDAIAPGFSMSATWADLDGDLDLDMYVSNMESVEIRRIERLPGHAAGEPWENELRAMSLGNAVLMQEQQGDRRVLVEAPASAGARDAKWAWGTAIFDWDEDGDLDIQCVNGFRTIGIDSGRDWDSVWWRHALPGIKRNRETWTRNFLDFEKSSLFGWSYSGHQRSVFFLNDGKAHFEEIGPVLGLDQVGDKRAIALGDIDRDGDYDLVGSSASLPYVHVLRNDTEGRGHFAWVELVPVDRRSAAGSQIRLTAGGRTQRRDIVLSEGFLTQHELARHFGLGAADRVERIEVTWPDGEHTLLEDLPVDRRFRLTQGVAGFEDVPLRARNFNATRRIGPVEWTNDPYQFELVDASLDKPLAAAVVPSPLADTSGRGTVRAVVLWDPQHAPSRPKLSALAELVGIEALEVVLVTPAGVEPPELPAGLAATHATYASDEQRARLLRALGRWCGTQDLPWPVVLYCGGDQVEAVSRGAIVPERVRAFCADR